VEFVCDHPYIYVPNSFTPNSDGLNDILYVRGKYVFTMELKIFNRWGELVFETDDQTVGWDGTYKGQPLTPDTYVYHLKVDCGSGENLIKGNVSILR
jgi:gliding motility-associated-like protein